MIYTISYSKEIQKYRDRYLSIRFEIRALLAHPEPNARLVIKKQNERSALERGFRELSLQYFLEARKVFKFEQISKLAYHCRLGFDYWTEAAWSPRWGRGKGSMK